MRSADHEKLRGESERRRKRAEAGVSIVLGAASFVTMPSENMEKLLAKGGICVKRGGGE
jgi:hypothetical protein